MWHCPNCGEQVEDNFDACWKCGTSPDGSASSRFVSEPDDPSVPDPGPESGHTATEETLSSSGDGHLTRRHIGELACQIIAIWLFVQFATTFPATLIGLLPQLSSSSDLGSDLVVAGLFMLIPLCQLAIGAALWKFADPIARRMVRDDRSPILSATFDPTHLLAVSFASIGVYVLISHIKSLVRIGYITSTYSPYLLDEWLDDTEFQAQFWTTLVGLGLATWLLFGSRGIAAFVMKIRVAGTPQDDSPE